MTIKTLCTILFFTLVALAVHASEIDFVERFSLADDRTVPLRELIPGTEDYYYYHCLHHQNRREHQRVADLLTQWNRRHGHSTRYEEIRRREILLLAGSNPDEAFERLRDELNLRFDHEKEQLARERQHPTRLDPALIARTAWLADAFRTYGDFSGVEEIALPRMLGESLDPNRRRHLLNRLRRPDGANLVEMIAADLDHRHSGGFGAIPIHSLLTSRQLEQLLALKPDLVNNTHYVNAVIARMRPSPDLDAINDDRVRLDHLERLWRFVQPLPAVHNSLKVHVLYQRLDYDRRHQVYDQGRFLSYLQLPRNASYINQNFMMLFERREHAADLNADFRACTALPPVGNDEALVREYLQHFLIGADDTRDFDPFIESEYLKRCFAETKILHGVGDQERWFSLIPAGELQSLKDRIELDFLPCNREIVGSDEPVQLQVAIKNVPKLIVKTYEINTGNFYRQQMREVTTGIDLDGLVANEERVITSELPPIRRHIERLDFPKIDRPGVFVVELIGNGISSRALIRKGWLGFTERCGAAGHVFTVFDEQRRIVTDAEIWLGGQHYRAEKNGEIVVPYSTRPGPTPFVLSRGEFASLQSFQHRGEEYRLGGGLHADREALLEGRIAQLVVRPVLTLNDQPIDIKLLLDPVIEIVTTDRDGTPSRREIRAPQLVNDREFVTEFKVPERLTRIAFTLRGEVEMLTRGGKKEKLELARELELNGIDGSTRTEDLYLRQTADGWRFELLGRTGEPRPRRAVHFQFKHRHFTRTLDLTLQTDDRGCIDLGALPDIARIEARGPEGTARSWELATDRRVWPGAIHAAVGEPIRVPWMGDPERIDPKLDVSLLEVRHGTFIADWSDRARAEPGFVVFEGLPPGDYDLLFRDRGTRIQLRVSNGQRVGRQLMNAARTLQLGPQEPLQVLPLSVDPGQQTLNIRLVNANAATRIHLIATRFVPEADPFTLLAARGQPDPLVIRTSPPKCQFLSGRNIGDEYRYILERKYAKILAGNLLKRPSLLLNPWNLRKTDTGTEDAAAGQAWHETAPTGAGRSVSPGGAPTAEPAPQITGGFSNLDFLPAGSLVMTNLTPDAQGTVTVDRTALGHRTQVHVVAVAPGQTVYRHAALADAAMTPLDLRLTRPLDPQQHFTEQRRISALAADQALIVEDPTTTRLEAYESIDRVYGLLSAISKDATLAEFAFVTRWPTLTVERKRELYSKYACHELSFFIAKKDPEFFQQVIRPYLANKKDLTFLDHWLLDHDLTPYTRPWAFQRLNIVERILLAQRISGEGPQVGRHVTDRFDLLTPDLERLNLLFKTALQGSALETGDRLGLADAKDRALEFQKKRPGAAMRNEVESAFDEEMVGAELEEGGADSFGSAETSAGAPVPQMAGKAMAVRPPAPPPPPPPSMRPAHPMAAPTMGARSSLRLKEEMKADLAADDSLMQLEADAPRRQVVRQLYRAPEKTEEWVENNYYRLPIERQVADLVTVNGFWRDYAVHPAGQPFRSTRVAEASRNFTEMMFALAVLDLPFEPGSCTTALKDGRLYLTPKTGAIVFHQEIRPAEMGQKTQTLLVGQNFFAENDRYRHEGNERFDKFVTEEFQSRRVYGCQVVLTNPTSSRQKVDVLLQIPEGAIPVQNGFQTRSLHRQLEPFSTQTIEYWFYFPHPGRFRHFPVHVARDEQLIAFTEPFTFEVVEQLTKIDTTSWPYVAQNGTNDEVLAYLDRHNIDRLDLDLMAFRLRDAGFFKGAIERLARRHVYHGTTWSYSLYHRYADGIREYLQHSDFPARCGGNLDSPWLTIDPVQRYTYQHREYWPLINARTYQLGKTRKILNRQFHAQYHELMHDLKYRAALRDPDRLAVVVYLLLQDRIEEAQCHFAKIADPLVIGTMQYDYARAWLAFSAEQPEEARAIAAKYRDHPVDRWRQLFQDVLAQADEIAGRGPKVIDRESREQRQTQLAATEPVLDLKVENRRITIRHQNVPRVRINYYLMDLELLFSRNPFVQEVTGQFSVIRPNQSADLELAADRASTTVELPAAFRDRNVMIELVAGGLTRSQAYYPHSLGIELVENYGQVRVAEESSDKPLPRVYVKVYARMKDGGEPRFYKDGYTDLRGRFDYASLSTDDLDRVERFAILIMSDAHGAVVREAAPPKR